MTSHRSIKHHDRDRLVREIRFKKAEAARWSAEVDNSRHLPDDIVRQIERFGSIAAMPVEYPR